MENIYLLTIDWATSDDANTAVYAYANFEDAKAKWEECRKDIIKDPEYAVILNSDGSVAEEYEDTYECLETREKEELFYEIYQNGYYRSEHCAVEVGKRGVIDDEE